MAVRQPAGADDPRGGDAREPDEPPPLFGTWRALYAAVIGELLLVILFCQWLTGRGR
jgi:hypothetical protein